MENTDEILIIGCGAVINEMKPLVDGHPIQFKTIDAGLHLHPEQLKVALQQAIDDHDATFDPIVLGFGLCSNAVVGLQARLSRLVVPRVDDCIAMLLGSQDRYRAEMAKAPGTYFLSKGWIDAGVTLMDEFKDMADRYGEARARKLQKKMFSHYTRLAYISNRHADQAAYRSLSRQAAEHLGLNYFELEGVDRLLQAMISGRWDDKDFLVVAPGRAITLLDFKAEQSLQ